MISLKKKKKKKKKKKIPVSNRTIKIQEWCSYKGWTRINWPY